MASIGDIKINMQQVGGHYCTVCGWYVGYGRQCACRTTSLPPVSPLDCNHCRCIAVPPSGERTKLHRKCCKCHDVMVAG